MRYPKDNRVLKKTLEVTTSGHVQQDVTALVIDDSAIFLTNDWTTQGAAADLTDSMSKQIEEKLTFQDKTFVFD